MYFPNQILEMLFLNIVKSLGMVVGIEVQNFRAGAGQGCTAGRRLSPWPAE